MSFVQTALQRLADAQVECFEGASCGTGLPTIGAGNDNLQIIMQLIFGILGGIALIMIILGAFYMNAAQGEPQKMARARQTVMFAVVGLAICVSAEAIVTFALDKL
jgi:hypothetical protein